MHQQENQITIVVSGPNASGKTAIVGLIADVLVHAAKFSNVSIAYSEQTRETIKEKVGALIDGKMDQVLNNPVVITETNTLVSTKDMGPPYMENGFIGHYRRGISMATVVWSKTKETLPTGVDLKLNTEDSLAPRDSPSY